MPDPDNKGERIYRGIAVSAGVCRGKVLILSQAQEKLPLRSISESDISGEFHRLEQALMRTRKEIIEVQRKVTESMGAQDASIFDAHLLVLEDPALLEEVTKTLQGEKINVESAFHKAAEKYAAALDTIDDDYLRERAADLRDVTARVLNQLTGRSQDVVAAIKEPCLIVSRDLTPSLTAQLDKKLVRGFVTEIGSKTSHTAIMARSLQIPAVVGLPSATTLINDGDYALLDGYNGIVIVNPTDQTLFEYGQLVRKHADLEEKLRDLRDKPAITLDGRRITLSANLEQPDDSIYVQQAGAEGVGLFRTEYLFINRDVLPTEEEQFQAYYQVASQLKPQPVVIRTLDLGGDKFLSHLQIPKEMNPFLGWRAIRYCLQEREIFRAQLRAILRASAVGNVKMMYPMISGLEELTQANALVEEYKQELRAENIPFDPNLEIGAMIEIPSAALCAEALAKRVKFFSLGTNDLIQYTLAVDRMNEKIAHLYQPTHPAIVHLIKLTVEAAHRNGIWAGVCGEMAGDPALTPLLLGLGVDELSAAPSLVPPIKWLIRQIKISEARELAEFALKCECGAEIFEQSLALAKRVAPSLFVNRT